MRVGRVVAQPPALVLLIGLEIALEPFHMAVALEGQDMRREPVEEEAIMADDHGAAGEILQRGFQRGQRFDVEVVGRLVEQHEIAALLQHLGQMHAVALAARKLADLLLLIRALEIEPAAIGAARHFALAERDHVVAAGNLLPDRLFRVERVARLVDITQLHRLADADRAAIGLFLADDHAEQRGFAGAVRPDDADDAARRQAEAEIVDQQLVAEAFRQSLGLDDDAAETRAGRNGDLRLAGLLAAGGLIGQLLVGFDARLGFGLPRLGAGPDPFQLARQGALAGLVLAALLFDALGLLLQPA